MTSVWSMVADFDDRKRWPNNPKPPYKAPHSWTQWPNPFPYVKDVQTLACSPKQLVRIAMWGEQIGRWAWSSFIPSPVELIRKTSSGSYKCGFYLLSDVPSPLDIIWQDKSASAAIAEIAAPVTTALFALWATQTAISFLDMAHTLYLMMEKCQEDENEGVMADGNANFAADHEVGTTPFYTMLWDPTGLGEPIDGAWGYPAGPVSIEAFGTISCAAGLITDVQVSILAGGVQYDVQHLGGIGPGGVLTYNVSMAGTMANAGAASVRLEIWQHGAGPFSTEAITKRFIIHYNQRAPGPKGGGVPDPCRSHWERLQAAMLPVV